MADTVDMKEDGEVRNQMFSPINFFLNGIFSQIESDEENEDIYKKVNRPQPDVRLTNNLAQARYDSEPSQSSDSNGEAPHKKFMKRFEM